MHARLSNWLGWPVESTKCGWSVRAKKVLRLLNGTLAARKPVENQLGDRRFATAVVIRLQGALLEALAAYHHEQALSLGAHRRELRRGRLAHLPDRVFDALVDKLAEQSAVILEGPLVRIAGFEVELSSQQQSLRESIGKCHCRGRHGRPDHQGAARHV